MPSFRAFMVKPVIGWIHYTYFRHRGNECRQKIYISFAKKAWDVGGSIDEWRHEFFLSLSLVRKALGGTGVDCVRRAL